MRRLIFLLPGLVMVVSAMAGPRGEEAFIRPELTVSEDEGQILLNGNLEFSFSRAALEALDNGLPLTVTTQITINDPNKWFFNKTVWSATYSHKIQYHALSQQYLVKDMQSDYPKALLSNSTAIHALGSVEKLALVEKSLIGAIDRYELQVKSSLDINSLPTPLRPLAYLSKDWRLQSEWKTWRRR